MTENAVYHALVLNLHQPAGNLEHLLAHQVAEAQAILRALGRIPDTVQDEPETARIHLSLSGTLLATLQAPEFQAQASAMLDSRAFLERLQQLPNLEVLGTAYYHPVLPLIPRADWEPQLEYWRRLVRRWSLPRRSKGFWPPEMGFCMEMIPLLKRQGYEFVFVDSEHVQPLTPMGWETLRYQPHIARFGGDEIVVIVRDRELSNAMANGLGLEEFRREVQARTQDCEFTPLVNTCFDGENGDWFRNSTSDNFWDGFYHPLLEQLRAGGAKGLQPVFIQDYLNQFGATGEVTVNSGAWNTGWHDGHGFMQWAGTSAQKNALNRLDEISQAVHAALSNAAPTGATHPEWLDLLQEAHRKVLRAETSCNFFWGDAWVMRCHADLDQACAYLEQAQRWGS